MNFVISILSLSLLLQSAFSSNQLTRLPLSNGHITNHPFQASRNLDAYFIDFSFMNETSVIETDFGTPFYTKNNGTNSNNTLMTVTISSNETVFFGNFSEGNNYFVCDPSYCTQDNSISFQYNSTWLTGNVTRIALNTSVSVAFGAWQLANPALYMAEAPSELANYAGGVYGSIGLGTGAGAQQNFYGQNPLFSILYNFSSSTGDLIFGYNSTYANTSKPSMTVTSDPNWQMQLASISVGNQTVYTVNGTNPITMLFDLTTQEIDFPSDIVTNVTNGMASLGMNCYGVGCTAPNLTGLPSIIFTLADNTQLTLSPEVYMMSTADSSDSTDTSDSADPPGTSDINFVTIPFETLGETGYFANHIVFGTQILAHFYTVFQQVSQGHTITLYSVPDGVTVEDQISPPITPDDSTPSPDVSTASNPMAHAIYIIISACVALLIVLIGTIILGVKRGWFKKKKASDDSTITVELNESQVSRGSSEVLTL